MTMETAKFTYGVPTVERIRCAALTSDGLPCEAPAKNDTDPPRCWFHDERPEAVAGRDISRRAGGRRRAYLKVVGEGEVDVTTVQGLQRQLTEVIENLRLQDNSSSTASAITAAVRAAGDLLTANVLEARFNEIEELIKEQSG